MTKDAGEAQVLTACFASRPAVLCMPRPLSCEIDTASGMKPVPWFEPRWQPNTRKTLSRSCLLWRGGEENRREKQLGEDKESLLDQHRERGNNSNNNKASDS